MKSTFTKIFFSLGVAGLLVGASSCSSLFEEPAQEVLVASQAYKDVKDADAAIIGIYGKFVALSKQHTVLNELRADLLDVTGNADMALREINNHDVKEGNPYANPRPFYEVILNTNDALKNFKIMKESGRLTSEQYEQRRADILTLRSYIYLQLGMHFGNVPYVTEALETVKDARAVVDLPRLSLPALVKALIKDMEMIPGAAEIHSVQSAYLDPYTAENPLVLNGLDTYASRLFFINKRCLLGDLYLWDNQYRKAVFQYRNAVGVEKLNGGTEWEVLEPNLNASGNCYKLTAVAMTSGMGLITVGYSNVADASTLQDNNNFNWRSIFSRDRSSAGSNATSFIGNDPEWLWMLPFDSRFSPDNSFVELFSPVTLGGSYLLKPSNEAIALWDAQTQINNIPYDARKIMSCKKINGSADYVATKHLYYYLNPSLDGTVGLNSYLTSSIYRKNGRWFLNRAANIHLKIAEASNRDQRSQLAYALLNNGVRGNFPVPSGTDVTNVHGMGDVDPVYKFDGRLGDIPRYRGIWRDNLGVRGRAYVKNTDAFATMNTESIENAIVTEGALELAFEGHRWGDLVRVALRRNDPAFLADKVYNKLKKANNPNAEAVRAKLMDPANWYLPFKM
ncbi:MAG: RagB/SusD family nutrient uptake outer membrane protein [Spirosomataceae bacterium]